jgi:hypothetical protein
LAKEISNSQNTKHRMRNACARNAEKTLVWKGWFCHASWMGRV